MYTTAIQKDNGYFGYNLYRCENEYIFNVNVEKWGDTHSFKTFAKRAQSRTHTKQNKHKHKHNQFPFETNKLFLSEIHLKGNKNLESNQNDAQ